MFEAIAQFPVGFIIALSGALIPGPMVAYISLRTVSSGAKTGTFAAGGHIIVELGILSLIALGLGFVLQSQVFQAMVGTLGGMLLIVLGALYLLRVRGSQELRQSTAGLKHHPLLGGILFSTILNPSVPLWWATIGVATLMNAFLVGALAAIFWVVGHFLADLSWFSLISYSIARGKWLMKARGYKALLFLCGSALLIFGAYFILRFMPLL